MKDKLFFILFPCLPILIFLVLMFSEAIDPSPHDIIYRETYNLIGNAVLEGQFTDVSIAKFKNKLIDEKLEVKYLDINISPKAARDNDRLTYSKCGELMTITVTYKRTRIYYYEFLGLLPKDKFYTSVTISKLSERQ